MGLIFRARRRIAPGVTANLSKHGVSVSAHRTGVTVNTRGRVTVRLGKDISFRL